ncbi:MAG TPA: DUF3347 domain-containing protein [Cyclobacteriaceae bacterium]
MKTTSQLFTLIITASLLFSNCSGKKEQAMESHNHAATEAAPADSTAGSTQFQVDAAFQQQLASLFTSYIALKDAFVATDAAKVKTEVASTQKALSNVDMKLVTGAAHNDWMTYLGSMEGSLKEIEAASDIEVQRKAFSSLSDNLYKTIKAYGLGGTTAYYEFCPMAFNDQGAFWLSESDKIRNPYFGDKMMTCGSVKETLQ